MEDLPAEVMVNIYKQLFEKDRRDLKLVSKRLNDCYRAFVLVSRRDPPKYLQICPYALVDRPCNAVQTSAGPLRGSFNEELYTIYHDCVCGRMAVVGAYNEWIRREDRDQFFLMSEGQENLPCDVILNIYRLLFEKGRRQLTK